MLRSRSTSFRIAALAGALAAGTGQAAFADVTLTSADGRWVATIEDSGGAAGQCNGLVDLNTTVAYQQFLQNTRHYVRMGTTLSYPNAVSQRMENIFSLLSFSNSAHSYTATLKCDTVPGIIAIVHGEMVSGAAGGLRVSLSFADTDPSDMVLAQYLVKPFVYANMNVDNQVLTNIGGWSTDHFYQSANNTETGNVRWFLGREPSARASRYYLFMQSALDQGVTELDNSTVTGAGDIATAMSFAAGGLGEDVTHTVAYAVGNQNISIPAGFGLPTNSGGVTITSSDHRWSASVRTGLGHTDFGAAGEITSVYDFNMPIQSSLFATSAAHYVAISPGTLFLGAPVRDAFERVAFFYPTDTLCMASAVLNSKQWPGVVLMLDAKMLPGDAGGLVVSMKFADTLGRNLNIAPVAFADINCDNQTTDTGGFEIDHFYQHGPGLSPYRWFRVPLGSFSSYQSHLSSTLQAQLNVGVLGLSNGAANGPGDLATAFAFHPWPLDGGIVYSMGYALGNPDIMLPSDFVKVTAHDTCAEDIAPASGDGMVNVDDLIAVIIGWGSCGKGDACEADIAPQYVGNGVVDVDDLIAVIVNWGPCIKQ